MAIGAVGKNAIPRFGRKRIFAVKTSTTTLPKCTAPQFPFFTFYQTGCKIIAWDIQYPNIGFVATSFLFT
jgi:hypothetical protein